MKKNVLLVGSFLSVQKGTMGISEKIASSDLSANYQFILASSFLNPILRLSDMVLRTIFYKGRTIHIDVYSGLAFTYTRIISWIAVIRKKNLILTLRGGALPEFTGKRKQKVLSVLQRADVIQSPSKYLIHYFKSTGLEVDYLPNPIDLKRFPFNRDHVKPYTLLWVRAFTSIYNPEVPIRVLSEIIKEYPQATLTMVGPDKGLQHKVEALATSLNLAHKVNFVGPVPNDELFTYYKTHHVYLNTTSYESFGVAVVEAAACGIPIVSNPVGEIPFLWQNEVDMLFAENNEIKNYHKRIKQLFESKELENKLTQNAFKKTREFDWELIKQQWIKLLSDDDAI